MKRLWFLIKESNALVTEMQMASLGGKQKLIRSERHIKRKLKTSLSQLDLQLVCGKRNYM